MEKFGDYILQEKIRDTRHSIIYRSPKENDAQSVIIKVLKTKYPTPSEIARFRQEYHRVKDIDVDGLVKTVDLVEHNNHFAIIEEDFFGISVRELIKSKKIGIKLFLQIAEKVSGTLGLIHQNNIIHLNLKPDTILINMESKVVKITGFGISEALTHANDALYHPEVIERVLTYISPEQTGRMNRSVDYRTDLYSLGVTLYEILTGEVPFRSSDPMELIHSHMARRPIQPKDVDSSIPLVISDIVMKLLSKNPGHRYQNSLGLMADFNECLKRLNDTGDVEAFPIAAKDISNRFNIPQVIVGREKELDILMASFERTSKGAKEIALMLGHPGIGKSALINEIHRPIVEKRGYFISGKYDQFRQDVPYSAIIQAFQGLIRQIFTESEEMIELWRDKINAALGINGKVICDVIPELSLIIGKHSAVETLGPEESQNRFNLVFQNFVNVFASQEHPLVIFLDDLQWADMASLNLFKTIMIGQHTKYLLFIGAYRDNEVAEHHPLVLTLNEIRKKGLILNPITLGPLDVKNVNKMITNILRCGKEESIDLAGLIHRKTRGNPFFVNQFLKNLYDNRLFELDPQSGWKWDIVKIDGMEVTDNVVLFMAARISKLLQKTQDILKICACIGNRFDLEMLSVVSKKSIEETLSDITEAVNEDLVNPFGDMYRFHHDRIQEATYSLIPQEDRSLIHYTIGRNVLENTNSAILNEKLFYIADQLNKGIDRVHSEQERLELAHLNHSAGVKAKDSTAYVSALNYILTGIGLLPVDSWKSNYELTYNLHKEQLECEYHTKNFTEAEKIFTLIVKNANNTVDMANVHSQMIILKNSTGEYQSALKIGYKGMEMVGFKLPGKVSDLRVAVELVKLRIRFGNMRIEDLADMPLMKQKEILAYVYLCIHTGNVAYFLDVNLFSFIVTRGINLFIQHGNIDYSPFAFDAMGSILGPGIGLYEQGYRFGVTALKLNDQMGGIKNRCKNLSIFVFFVLHWKKHAKHGLDYLREAYKAGLQSGDHIFSGYAINILAMHRIMLGHNLDEILQEYTPYQEFQMNAHDPFTAKNCKENVQMIRCLKGLSKARGRLDGEGFNEEEQLKSFIVDGNKLGQVYFLTTKLRARYLFGLTQECMDISQKILKLLSDKAALGCLQVPEFYFYYSLLLADLDKNEGIFKKIKGRLRLMLNQVKMRIWAHHCPENFLHKYLLVEAERARMNGKKKKAYALYDEAIRSAHENEYTQNEAIAGELAAIFSRETGDIEKAHQYMKEAHYAYIRWGASEKAKDLEEKYPDLIAARSEKISDHDEDHLTDKISTIGTASIQNLDFATVIKTSQSLSSDIDLGKLLSNIMKLSIENAGAQSGYLILKNETDNKIFIEATGRIEGKVSVLQSIPIDKTENISASIVNYVNKTGENIVLPDASIDPRFVNDPYIIRKKPRSLLCVPIRHKGKTSGIIYLENNLTTDAFTPERIQLLQILSSQAAISIENSRLIKHRENEATLRTEMKIAAEIQQALLPKNPSINGFEITGYMLAADDVGGDYYDVINTPTRDWVAIGDVSGHGVPAGLIMMMVQTAIQTMVRAYPEIKPSQLLSAVNEAIKYNLENMAQQKYMTITVFSFDKEGKALYSGLHQDLIIYRSETGKVEQLKSEGIWLSPWDMGQKNIDTHLQMNSGDVLLLYSDGITEAKNDRGEMFSEEKLVEIISDSASQPTEQIKNQILDKMKPFRTDDDIAMFILKRA